MFDAIRRLESADIGVEARRRARLDHARRSMRMRRWNGMRDAWTSILKDAAGGESEACVNLALLAQTEGNGAEAREWLDRAEHLGHDVAEVELTRATLHEEERRLTLALNCAERAAALATPELADKIAIRLARLRRLQKKIIEDHPFGKVEDRWRKDAQVEMAARASARQAWGDAIDALELVRGELNEDELLQLAKAYRAATRLYEARQVLDLVRDARLADAVLLEEASMASARKDWNGALLLWTEVITRMGESDRAWWELARSKRQLGDLEGAKAALAMCKSTESSWSIAREAAMLATKEQRWADAVEGWRRVFAHNKPPGRFSHLYMAEALARTGDATGAREQLHLFSTSGPETTQSMMLGQRLQEASVA